ncbi:MAG TPA: hypothetical protein DCZ95_04320 [Verrucomicrobia bacterium]|nr:MAG: hypothetical protein A2X46_07720 [Lentisphaerae bacterium GWF2_57_35]HBA83301.1 hypothetical protein [Verrucomicrobiota bacterium]
MTPLQLPLPEYYLLPLVLNLVVLTICGLYYSHKFGGTKASLTGQNIYRCSGCGHVYVDDRDVPLARCNRCGIMNEAVKR